MKNFNQYIRAVILLAVTIAACKKEETPIFDQKPQERMANTLNALDKELTEGNGWTAYIFTKLRGEGFSFYIDFLGQNRVQMMSDIDPTTATTPKESSYRVKWMEQPTLLFDTYNYIHRLADPMPSGGNVGGIAGNGLVSDFEFALTEATIDTLKNYPEKLTQLITVGRKNNIHVTFNRASAEEAEFWKNGDMVPFISEVNAYMQGFGAKFAGITAESGKTMQLSLLNKMMTLYWYEGDSLIKLDGSYTYGPNKFILQDTINFDGKNLTGFVWENNTLYAVLDSKKIPLEALDQSILPPLSGAIGKDLYTSITNSSNPLNGTSDDFTARRNAANNAMYTGPYRLTLGNMEFKFDAAAKTVTLTTIVYQGSTPYLAIFVYNYTQSDDGVFKFNIDNNKTNGNGALIEGNMSPILGQRFNTDHFVVQYANQNGSVIGQFVSVEHPDFTFSGALQ